MSSLIFCNSFFSFIESNTSVGRDTNQLHRAPRRDTDAGTRIVDIFKSSNLSVHNCIHRDTTIHLRPDNEKSFSSKESINQTHFVKTSSLRILVLAAKN